MKYLKPILLLVIMLLLPVTIFATQTTKDCEQGFKRNSLGICEEIKAPERGKLNRFKDDFKCERGFVKNKQNWSCDEIKLPENGVLTLTGNDWTCIANYKRVGDKCEKVLLPENAKFYIQGPDWYCNFGYKKDGDKCTKIELPTNARWSYDGNDWECVRGFKVTEDNKSCEKITVPENATANYIGSFDCSSGFKKVGDICEKQPDIENGRFYTTGADFYCSPGFKKNESERKCEEIKPPTNATKDSASLESWKCNSGYIKEGNECKEFKLPEKAYWSENTWKCEVGYRKNPTQKTCEKISLPENAKYIDSYDGWICNNGYTKNYRENRCDKI